MRYNNGILNLNHLNHLQQKREPIIKLLRVNTEMEIVDNSNLEPLLMPSSKVATNILKDSNDAIKKKLYIIKSKYQCCIIAKSYQWSETCN